MARHRVGPRAAQKGQRKVSVTDPRRTRAAARRHDAALTPFDAADYLRNEATIAEFLNEALRTQDPRFLLTALGTVARARGMTTMARATGLGRENLYKALSSRANPRIETIFRVAAALGVRFEVRVA